MGLKLIDLTMPTLGLDILVSVPLRGNGFETAPMFVGKPPESHRLVSIPLRGNGFETQMFAPHFPQ